MTQGFLQSSFHCHFIAVELPLAKLAFTAMYLDVSCHVALVNIFAVSDVTMCYDNIILSCKCQENCSYLVALFMPVEKLLIYEVAQYAIGMKQVSCYSFILKS